MSDLYTVPFWFGYFQAKIESLSAQVSFTLLETQTKNIKHTSAFAMSENT